MAETTPPVGGALRPRVLMVAAGSLLSAVSTYVLNIVAARTMSVPETTVLLTNLALLFFFYGILAAVTTEFTRSTAVATLNGAAEGPKSWHVIAGIAVLVSLALLVTSVWLRNAPGTSVSTLVTILMATGVLGFAAHAALCGVLAGAGRWPMMSLLVGAEGAGRIIFAGAVIAVGATADRYLGAVVAASFVWLVFVLSSRTVRVSLQQRMDAPLRLQVSRFGAAFAAQAASAALTVSFPVLLSWTTSPAEYAVSAPLLLAISITRAPLMIPLTAYQSMIVAHFSSSRERTSRDLAVLSLGVLSVGATGALAAWWVGPALFTWLISSAYHVDGRMLAVLTMAAAVLALVTLTGAVSQALSLHRWFVLGWVLALAVAVALLFVPGTLEFRAGLALVGGPAVGVLTHMAAIVHAERERRVGQTAA